jgi:hypothetical protein
MTLNEIHLVPTKTAPLTVSKASSASCPAGYTVDSSDVTKCNKVSD